MLSNSPTPHIQKNKGITMLELLIAITIFTTAVPPIVNCLSQATKIPDIDFPAVCLMADMDNCITNRDSIRQLTSVSVKCIFDIDKDFNVEKTTEKMISFPGCIGPLELNTFTITNHPAKKHIKFVAYSLKNFDMCVN